MVVMDRTDYEKMQMLNEEKEVPHTITREEDECSADDPKSVGPTSRWTVHTVEKLSKLGPQRPSTTGATEGITVLHTL